MMETAPSPTGRSNLCLFICYSQVNKPEKLRLITHLTPMVQKFNVELWHDEKIALGSDWKDEIQAKLTGMNIFLFLVSADSLASEFVNQVEYVQALEEYKKRQVELIPILIQPCDWRAHDVSRFQCLPRSGEPISSLPKPEEGYTQVSTELRQHLENKYFRAEQQNREMTETQDVQDSNNTSVSPINEEPMYRESWKSQPLSNGEALPLQKLIKSLKEVMQFRNQLSRLDEDLASFKSDLSLLLNQISRFLKELEDTLKESGNEGHRIFRIGLETQSKVSEIRKQLLIANTHSPKGLQALANLTNRDLIYFGASLEKLENSLKSVFKDDFDIKPN